MTVRLFTTFYREPRRARLAEYVECLNRNLASEAIDSVCVLVEASENILPASGKLEARRIAVRPLYDDFFRWINEVANPDDISVVANADVWFDHSLAAAARAIGTRECFALARWDGDKLFDRNDSQDSWIFRGRVEGLRGDFPIGVPRCDNRMLYELEAAGYRVRNPAFSIRARHVHAGERGEYANENPADSVAGPYRYLWPENMWPLWRTISNNFFHPGKKLGWRLDTRRLGRALPFRAVSKLRRAISQDHRRDDSGSTGG